MFIQTYICLIPLNIYIKNCYFNIMLKYIKRLFSQPPRASHKSARRHNDSKSYNNVPKHTIFKTNESSNTIPQKKYPGESPQEYDVIFEGVEKVEEETNKPITDIMGDQRKAEIQKRKRINYYAQLNHKK